jgi:hypothetical protein
MALSPNDLAYPRPDNATAGVNVREHFAAMALQGLLARYPVPFSSTAAPERDKQQLDAVAIMAVTAADSLIAALNRR